jgi:hypothetical protein
MCRLPKISLYIFDGDNLTAENKLYSAAQVTTAKNRLFSVAWVWPPKISLDFWLIFWQPEAVENKLFSVVYGLFSALYDLFSTASGYRK